MNINWPGSDADITTLSYSWIVLNGAFDRIASLPFFADFTCKRINRALPIEAGYQVPFLGVYLSDETLSADGDIGAGDVRFTEISTLGFQIIIVNNDPVALLKTLHNATTLIKYSLLTDNTFTNRLRTTMLGNLTIEGFPRGRVRERWGMTGSKNEVPLGERSFELAFQIRTAWYPSSFPDLERITVTTAFPLGGDTMSVKQVKWVAEFTPDAVVPPLPTDTAATITSTTLAVSPASPQDRGTNITFTATVTPAAVTGTVVFFDGGTLIGSAPVTAGSAAFSTTALIANAHVPHSITARYNGDATYKQSTSPAVLYTIT